MFDAIIYKIEVNTLVLSILVQLTANALSPWDWFHRVSVQGVVKHQFVPILNLT